MVSKSDCQVARPHQPHTYSGILYAIIYKIFLTLLVTFPSIKPFPERERLAVHINEFVRLYICRIDILIQIFKKLPDILYILHIPLP